MLENVLYILTVMNLAYRGTVMIFLYYVTPVVVSIVGLLNVRAMKTLED